MTLPEPLRSLRQFILGHPRLLVLTGAGCSTPSGIPDYRDRNGEWKHRRPVAFADFVGSEAVRRRYWARSLVGFERIRGASPNDAHRALARLEAAGRIECLITQNVDGLHQRAGSRAVIDLHGRLDTVTCLDCGAEVSRADFQTLLLAWNPRFAAISAFQAPDGDAMLEGPFDDVAVPDCPRCGRLLKPSVVFFGESVPKHRVADAFAALERADALLVVGSSVMVYSGFRFCLAAAAAKKPIALLNLGRTRADEIASLKVELDCAAALSGIVSVPAAYPSTFQATLPAGGLYQPGSS